MKSSLEKTVELSLNELQKESLGETLKEFPGGIIGKLSSKEILEKSLNPSERISYRSSGILPFEILGKVITKITECVQTKSGGIQGRNF